MRYSKETYNKTNGIVYTPRVMADYLSKLIINNTRFLSDRNIRILDPAIGDGELIISILSFLKKFLSMNNKITVVGFETDATVIKNTKKRILANFPEINIEIKNTDFIDYMLKKNHGGDLFTQSKQDDLFDYIIANPPYVRTQVLGSAKAQDLSLKVDLSGRVDLYYAFLVMASKLLKENGIAGFITSNKFMTIKSGKTVRECLLSKTKIIRIVDFGDTKIFNAAVLPCIIVFKKGTTLPEETQFTSIYETNESGKPLNVDNIFEALDTNRIIQTSDGRKFEIKHGTLAKNETGLSWRLTTKNTSAFLDKIDTATWKIFGDIGKIRVGIKTTADNVFIKEDWTKEKYIPELLYPLITHRNSGQILGNNANMWQVLYPYIVKDNKKITVNINDYPNAKKYLEIYREQLESREYLMKANRYWYEIWVPQNPLLWKNKKIIFRDIVEKPQFWLDETGAIVNGDCYWIDIVSSVSEDILLLALAVANSNFIEKYYDIKFNNKLYSGKRRFMAQYVENFPIPNPATNESKEIVKMMKKTICDGYVTTENKARIDNMVENIFS
jgi:tRNA1(Val) A37 N6-methylase TrmN6